MTKSCHNESQMRRTRAFGRATRSAREETMTLLMKTALRCGRGIAAATAALALLGLPAAAQEREQSGTASNVEQPAAKIDAPNARLAALIRPPGVVIMNKGVQDVSNPAKGIYCILPSKETGIDVSKAVAVVSVDFFYSKLNEVQVQWASGGSPCPNSRFAVYTLSDRNLTARYNFNNDVGFVIYVP
jgi:hypothetical protein